MAATVVSASTAATAASVAAFSSSRDENGVGLRNRVSFAPLPVIGNRLRGESQATRSRRKSSLSVECSASGETSATPTSASASEAGVGGPWIPVIPTSALPRGERRLIRQDGENVLLLWYKDGVYAVENSSPAEGAYSEGMFNAKLTPDGCIVCPSTESKFDLKTGEIKDWYPTNPILAFLTKPTRIMDVYPVKVDSDYVYINMRRAGSGQSAEIVFGGQTQAGKTATDVNVEETRMVVDEKQGGFGFTPYNEMVNGRAAMLGFTMLLIQELVTGEGFLKGTGFLDFLYKTLGR
ncbi:hypothetical protein R1flu_017779 [Riccia fluitans]|uniref:Rieske domain-containing protein n=1 Tax=Riccia fluitans TaxID=41844 RepID=A0ABD1ZDY0_9MARC